ncbi:Protein N-acetyltransferase, RimJ/RimL family [Catalinimonas alkaloidigena]|uniref:Protein N-acetyltransferase, RimJ/RimL family n=1 Tax=Catalinimonas alkaloidigena TaxID=1075417 RepID=A0A1G9NH61_9BACT|nr:GNAT family N-acetyltransferase [Catalinimonas alkaloidigena]SDL85417.1 Protein N-acetyltransferase, RimJ/RimL family [Catalinimonas alkaloidigena]
MKTPPRSAHPTSHLYFQFPPLMPSARLQYEPLDEANAQEVFQLFTDDPNPFIIEDYKQEELWEQYVQQHLFSIRYSLKRAGYDWVYRLRQAEGAVVGMINLYGLSRETGEGQRNTATIGFTTGMAFRRQGYTQEAIHQLVAYIFQHFDVAAVVAFTERDNEPSQRLLQKVGFVPMPHDTSNRFHYFERMREGAP